MHAHRLQAPAIDGAVLADPPLAEAGRVMNRNADRLRGWEYDFQGRPVGWLRDRARAEASAASRAYHEEFGLDQHDEPAPDALAVVTGHQPELFHPGVWVKNFALGAIAGANGASTLNLIVDNDTPKGASVRVPARSAGTIRVQAVDFDAMPGEAPFEDQAVRDEAAFASFADRALGVLGNPAADPLLRRFWPKAVAQGQRTDRAGLRFALARREVEADWGVRNREVPLGRICETEAFGWFATHLLAHLPRFLRVHNEALARYRDLYKIRSRHHPVPALARRDDWLEAPFWAWRADAPRRRPLLARQASPGRIEIRIEGETELLGELPLGPDRDGCCAVERLLDLPGRGVRLRTRALTTTMFARLLLGDLFLHGIGGAKYDELGDEIVSEFFGIEPPTFLVATMTLWMDLGADPAATPERRQVLGRALRDLAYNPDRALAGSADPEVARRIASKHEAIAGPVGTHRQRVERFRAIRRCNEVLAPLLEDRRAELEAERARLVAALARNARARSREYAAVLHPEDSLREAFARAVTPAP